VIVVSVPTVAVLVDVVVKVETGVNVVVKIGVVETVVVVDFAMKELQ
jgi:hypothetical protein